MNANRSTEEMNIGEFELGRIIGKGTFGNVIIGRHIQTKTNVAIKCIKKTKISSNRTFMLLKNEEHILSILKSPFTVDFFGFFQDNYCFYLITEYIAGGELFKRLQTRRKIHITQVRFYAAEITSVFIYLHNHCIIYRDLKPENILITASGHIKLIDFGFATELKHGDKDNTFCGTLDYLAPEMINRTGHDHSIDWWTLGVLLYELLIGCTPFHSKTSSNVYDKILKSEPIFPKGMDSDAQDLICKLLVKDPQSRIKGEDVKNHPFFTNINWTDVEKMQMQPIWIPLLMNDIDTTYYDVYPETSKFLHKIKTKNLINKENVN